MPARDSESLILRSYPFREADLVVAFFTRDRGKLRGIARGVRRPKSRFGSSLERLSFSKVYYFQKDTIELVRIDRAELIGPPSLLRADYPTSIVLDLIAETADQLLPDHEQNDAFFRLMKLVLEEFWKPAQVMNSGIEGVSLEASRSLIYFIIWSLKLSGWLAPLHICAISGEPFAEDDAGYFNRLREGLFKGAHKDRDAWKLRPAARRFALQMLRRKLGELDGAELTREDYADLERFLVQQLESHLEGRLRGAAALTAVRAPG